MNCETAKQQLGAYLDDELPIEAYRETEAHLSECPGCSAELASIRELANKLVPTGHTRVPEGLWSAIEKRLDSSAQKLPKGAGRSVWFRRYALAASLLVLIGLGSWAILSFGDGATVAKASAVDFSMLLDALPKDASAAFDKFLAQYDARQSTPAQAKRAAPRLNFEIPDALPGGFRLDQTYVLRFGKQPGAAAKYTRNDELLVTIFHQPVRQEDFGTHADYPCVIGQHRGHAVSVGDWRLVHVTDSTTCHCVLSKLGDDTGLPEVIRAVAPNSIPQSGSDHHSHTHDS